MIHWPKCENHSEKCYTKYELTNFVIAELFLHRELLVCIGDT